MVLVQNKYKNTCVGVRRTQITFVTHSSPSCYVTLHTHVIRLNSGNLGPQKTDSGVFIISSVPILVFLKFGYLLLKIKMLRGIPALKPYVNLHLHDLDNLKDINEFKNLKKVF